MPVPPLESMPSVRVMPPAGPPILPAAILDRINDGSKLQGPASCRFRKRLFCGGLPEHPPGSCSQRTPESNHDQGCCRHLVNCGFVAALIKGAAAFLQVHRRGDAGGDLPDAGRRTLRPLRPAASSFSCCNTTTSRACSAERSPPHPDRSDRIAPTRPGIHPEDRKSFILLR